MGILRQVKAAVYNNPYWDEIKDRLSEVIDMSHLFMTTDFSLLDRDKYTSSFLDRDKYTSSLWVKRKDFCGKYCWAIPDPNTLAFVAQWLGPCAVEIGAGTGYFAWMLQQRGIEVVAYDIAPPHISCENEYHGVRTKDGTALKHETREVYFPVEIGGPKQVEQHTDRTLFLCWPPYASDMASLCLQHYHGNRLVYIGESDDGCNADDAFFEMLERDWHEVAEHKPIQWDAIHDWVYVYERGAEQD